MSSTTVIQPRDVLIGGQWRPATSEQFFQADNPTTGEPLPEAYPVSAWSEVDAALDAAQEAFAELRRMPTTAWADFLDGYAARIEGRRDDLVEMAHQETGLPKSPRLADGELPRTTGQLRQAAAAVRDGGWALPTIDADNNIRSYYGPVGPVAVFGPNNFPYAFGSASGGDFAAAIAAGNPVLAKANTSHPGTTRIFAEEALAAVREAGLPASTVQLIYRTSHADGERLAADPRLGAIGYTGSRTAGLKLKAAADAVGKPIFLELSSVNPVFVLPGALAERADAIVAEFTGSCLMGTGQFCTNPGVVMLLAGEATERFIQAVQAKFEEAPAGVLLSRAVANALHESVRELRASGATLLTGGEPAAGEGYRYANTLLRVDASAFLEDPEAFQREAFGNASLFVVAETPEELEQAIDQLEGNLTGSLYTAADGGDDALYDRLAFRLRLKVGRLLNDKMPTGVAVSPAMNHGGPFPATGHPHFTAVGIPASIRRFATLQCFDNVRPERLPEPLRDRK